MNKNIYRVIFNKARGLFMVTGEITRSRVKASGHESGQSKYNVVGTMKPLYFAVLLAFGLLGIVPSHAQIVSGANGPHVGQAQNGVPVVNINQPGSTGVSHNKYSRFDIQQNGAILNNGRTSSQTQLAGWIQGNPNLAGGTARVILNEVNSANPSHLRGYLEVAGSMAQVIVANPTGIVCNGCGFINANRATMTTGTPIMNGDRLDGFNVRGGSIRIEGDGLDASRADYTDLIARTVEINAGVWGGKKLRVTTGANRVNADNTLTMPVSADPDEVKPQVAIDVAHLGGMYAGKIILVGTENGVGVKNAGEIGAAAGQLLVTASGKLENIGTMQSTTRQAINAHETDNPSIHIQTGQLQNSGLLMADGNLSIKSRDIANHGQIISQNDMTLEAGNGFTNKHDIQAAGNMNVRVAGDLKNESHIGSGQILDMQAASVDNAATGEIVADTTKVVAMNDLTNRGVVDGRETFVAARNLTNTGTGAIFGDHITIRADNLVNREEGNKAAIIAARDRMDIAAKTITNREDAMLTSMGDMAIGGELDENRLATGRATTLNNSSATIEAEGNLVIAADTVNNINAHLRTAVIADNTVDHIVEYAGRYTRRFDSSEVQLIATTLYTPGKKDGDWSTYYTLHTPDGADTRYTMWSYNRAYTRTAIIDTAPGKITSGLNMVIWANTVNNTDSHILAGGRLDVTANVINNHETSGTLTYTDSGYSEYFWYHDSKYSIHTCSDGPVGFGHAPVSTTIGLGTMKFAENQQSVTSGTQISSAATVDVPKSSLFSTNPDATAGYLVETNPKFADYKEWISSDYMIAQMGLDLTGMTKRLGDGYYEQKLVQEQIAELTGRRFLEGYASNEQQYKALLDNGVTYAMQWDIRPGVALSDTQLAQLTSDIVWLVEKEVTLPNGETTLALVPQVYLMPREGDITGTGSLIAANTVNLNLSGDITNQGTIAGREVVAINAENIDNIGGRITGDAVGLLAHADINNIGGTIDAANHLEVTAGRNINVASTTVANEAGTRTDIDRLAGLYITSDLDGVMLAYAGNDININGAIVNNNSDNGVTSLHADNNLAFGTVETSENANFNASGIKRQESSTTQIGSTVVAKGDVQMSAGNDLTAQSTAIVTDKGNITLVAANDVNLTTATNTASVHEDMKRGKKSGFSNGDYALESGTTVQSDSGHVQILAANNVNARGAYVGTAQGAVDVVAGNDVTLTASEDHVFQDNYFKYKQKGFLSKKTTTTYDMTDTMTSQGTTLSGNTVNVAANHDINIKGSNVVGSKDVSLAAGNDINLVAATDTVTEQHYKKVKKSGLMSSGGFGFTIGSQQQSLDNQATRSYASASTVGSTDGNVNMVAGNKYLQEGSHVMAPAGDTNIMAKQVDIVEAQNTFSSKSEYKFKKSGITVALSNPVISAVQTAHQMSEAVKDTNDGRMTLLAAANVALAGRNAYNAVEKGNNAENANLAEQAGGINISISIGTSKSSSQTTAQSSTASGSTVAAGNNINIIAAGGGEDSNLTVRGSDIAAGNNINLIAENQLNLLAAQNTAQQHSTNKNSSGSLGVSFGTSGLGVTVAGSVGRGKADGSDVTWTNTHVEAGNGLMLQSGGDTNMIGAVAKAEQVLAGIGGNLDIESLQDISTYDSKQKSVGGSLTVGVGGITGGSVSYNGSKINSDYASVTEQSGIRAGDGGFQVDVKGNTDLKGGAITSTQKAIDNDRNTFNTDGTLTLSDIKNKASYEGKAAGVNLGAVPSLDGSLTPGSSSAGTGHDSGSDSSMTLAAISDIAGNTEARTGDAETGLDRIFDAEKVQKNIDAQVKITQKFNELAPPAAADYAAKQAKSLKEEALRVMGENPEKAAELLAEAKKWEPNGEYSIAMNLIIAAAGGEGTGAAQGVAKESLSWAADQMRKAMIEDSWTAPPFCDSNGKCINNISGESVGVNGDNSKLAGGRIDKEKLCAVVQCTILDDNSIRLTDGKDENGLDKLITWDEILKREPDLVSPLGGLQGGDGIFKIDIAGIKIDFKYEFGDFLDKLAEAYAGTHDYLNSGTWYGPDGNIKPGMTQEEKDRGEIMNKVNVVLATPFALSVLLPPEVWNAIGTAVFGK